MSDLEHPDVVRTRRALAEASAEVERADRRRDSQARLIADTVLGGDAVDAAALQEYGDLTVAHADAVLFWRVAFDAWTEACARVRADAG